ncbi:hypothetical protein TWF481_011340 [Arthrobotrys musiformis]|uniref:Uncharacterized protein n=1 Tax=Arthrobotrys musiformis TaxID=47236 RepID=A0AAV9VZH7_9PEZI
MASTPTPSETTGAKLKPQARKEAATVPEVSSRCICGDSEKHELNYQVLPLTILAIALAVWSETITIRKYWL